jgi:hypothetical protein
MTDSLNKFLDALKALIESGYVKNGQQFLGTGVGGIFRVVNFDNNEKGFTVQTEKPTASNMPLTPVIAVYSIGRSPFSLVGSKKNTYVFNIEMFFSDQLKTVDSVVIKRERLARYFMEQMNAALDNMADRFTTVNVLSLNSGDSAQQDGKYNNTNLFGFTCSAEVTLG